MTVSITIWTVSTFTNAAVDVILSLTRTNRVGYLRDIRRITVALSRARLGLYILGRREVFESCFELRHAFNLLFERPDTLALVVGEIHPSSRSISNEVESTEMEGLEHLGQYVYEMTQAKVAAMTAANISSSIISIPRTESGNVMTEEEYVEEEDTVSDEPEV